MQSGGGVFCKVEGVYYAKWRGCIMQSGGGVLCKVEGVYFAKWRGCILQSGEGVFILQGKSYI